MKTSNETSAHPRCINKTSEFLGILLCTTAYVLQKRYPVALFGSSDVANILGYLLLLVSAAIMRRTLQELAEHDQPHEPGRPTTKLVKTGPFCYSHNPTYTMVILFLQPGLALTFGSVWLLTMFPISFGLFWYVMVRPEEQYLHQKFGLKWQEYCKQTHRWL